MKRIIECDRKCLKSFYLDVNNADIGKIEIYSTGRVYCSSKPDCISLAKWLHEVYKVIKIALKIYCFDESTGDKELS